MRSRYVFPLVVLALVRMACAQFYAPETEFHDLAQRVFPVEAARVLAAQQNAHGADIAEVSFEVSTDQEGTEWHLRWNNNSGKVIRESVVRYPDTLMAEGPRFYREVFRQLCGTDWMLAKREDPATAREFWRGADTAGTSRMEAAETAIKFAAEQPDFDAPSTAARLAGLLAHGTMASFVGPCTLDSVFLARAAAWLCCAEARTGEEVDTLWCPILFLSSREKAAGALWANHRPGVAAGTSAAERFWNLMLRKPTVKDAFVFAARAENDQFAMPAMIYFAFLEKEYLNAVCSSAQKLFGQRELGDLHDYSPYLSARAGLIGPQLIDGPGQSRRALVQTLAAFTPSAQDYSGYKEALPAALKASAAGDRGPLAGLEAAAPIINAGLHEGTGKLIPVVHVTARDLLCHGWEMQGWQLARFHHYLARTLSVRQQAQAMAERCFALLDGIEPFFGKPDALKNFPLPTPPHPLSDPLRLQFHTDSHITGLLVKNLNDPRHLGSTCVRRCWLSRSLYPLDALSSSTLPPEELHRILKRCAAEGGQTVAYNVLLAIDPARKNDVLVTIPGIDELRQQLVEQVPVASYFRVRQEWEKAAQEKQDWFAYGQAVEKIGWEVLQPVHFSDVFACYIRNNALESARRYYDQIRPFVSSPVVLSNTIAPRRWTLAWLDKDETMMRQVLADVASYSQADLNLQAVNAIAHEQYEKAQQCYQAVIARYSGHKDEEEMLGFLPLIPALKDAAHPDHEQALDYFKERRRWVTVQWMLIQQCKLDRVEAVRFLGGENTDPIRQLVIAAMDRDKTKFETTLDNLPPEVRDLGNTSFVLLHHLRCDLFEVPAPAEQPDLMPKDTVPLEQFVAQEMRRAIDAANSSQTSSER